MTSQIHWLSRDALRLSMPTAFRKFTDIFMERPTDLLALAQVWNNYIQDLTKTVACSTNFYLGTWCLRTETLQLATNEK